eukprot:991838_1
MQILITPPPHHSVEYKEEEEEKTFNAHTMQMDQFNSTNSNVIIEMDTQRHPTHPSAPHQHVQETVIHPHKSWFQKQMAVKPQSVGLSCGADITRCEAIKRIVYLLEFYKSHQRTLLHHEESVIPLFEHLSSLKNYGMSMFMEDWYQCKQNHFKTLE